MDITQLIIFLALGALVGWVAGLIIKGRGFGLIGNIIVGIVGAVLGGELFRWLGISITGSLGSLAPVAPFITATIGAVILLGIISLIKRV